MKDYTDMEAEDRAEFEALGQILALLPRSHPEYKAMKKRYDKLANKGVNVVK